MGLTKILRSLGLVVGVILVAISIYNMITDFPNFSDPYFGYVMLFSACFFIPGVLLLLPWSRIKSRRLYLVLVVAFTLCFIFLCCVIYITSSPSLTHNTNQQGTGWLILFIIVSISQFLVLWSYYLKNHASA